MPEAEKKAIARRFNEDVSGKGDEAALEKLLAQQKKQKEKKPYAPPRIEPGGTVTDLSQTGLTNPGADGKEAADPLRESFDYLLREES